MNKDNKDNKGISNDIKQNEIKECIEINEKEEKQKEVKEIKEVPSKCNDDNINNDKIENEFDKSKGKDVINKQNKVNRCLTKEELNKTLFESVFKDRDILDFPLHFYDFEFSSQSKTEYRPIEIGISTFKLNSCEEIDHFHELIYPQFIDKCSHAFSKKIHGIPYDNPQLNKNWKQICNNLNNYFNKYEINIMVSKESGLGGDPKCLETLYDLSKTNMPSFIYITHLTLINYLNEKYSIIEKLNIKKLNDSTDRLFKQFHFCDKCEFHKTKDREYHCALSDARHTGLINQYILNACNIKIKQNEILPNLKYPFVEHDINFWLKNNYTGIFTLIERHRKTGFGIHPKTIVLIPLTYEEFMSKELKEIKPVTFEFDKSKEQDVNKPVVNKIDKYLNQFENIIYINSGTSFINSFHNYANFQEQYAPSISINFIGKKVSKEKLIKISEEIDKEVDSCSNFNELEKTLLKQILIKRYIVKNINEIEEENKKETKTENHKENINKKDKKEKKTEKQERQRPPEKINYFD